MKLTVQPKSVAQVPCRESAFILRRPGQDDQVCVPLDDYEDEHIVVGESGGIVYSDGAWAGCDATFVPVRIVEIIVEEL